MEENELNAIRAELASALERESLRSVARDVGMTPSGLAKVVASATPYAKTRRLLHAWSERRRAGGREREVDAALDVLLRELDPAQREEARESIRRTLGELRERPKSPEKVSAARARWDRG
jgi:hypothetical protein